MKFKDPIAPTNGQMGELRDYEKKFAWYPQTTSDGYSVWLETIYVGWFGAANTSIKDTRLEVNARRHNG